MHFSSWDFMTVIGCIGRSFGRRIEVIRKVVGGNTKVIVQNVEDFPTRRSEDQS